ncbi:hypothetical protein V6N13_050441 [Hibiscus sabdariffa]
MVHRYMLIFCNPIFQEESSGLTLVISEMGLLPVEWGHLTAILQRELCVIDLKHSQLGGQKGDGQRSILHNAMILFGEIENIKSSPSRHFAFADFRILEEARIKGPLPDILLSDHPFISSQMDMFGQNHTVLTSTVAGPLATSGILGSNVPIRPFNCQGLGPPLRQTSGFCDVYDVSQFQRDAKRSRIEASLPIDDASLPLRKMDDLGPGSDHIGPVIGAGVSGSFFNVQGKVRVSPVPGMIPAGKPGRAFPDNDYIWCDIIAKGGTPTSLFVKEKLDSEDDFASYTEFLHYLGSKNRAGVAKFDDGTTLFLVPPSEFLMKVLKLAGPERLYGVVLKLPPQVPSFAVEYGWVFHEELVPCEEPREQSTVRSQPPNNSVTLTQSGVALTPDLIATLASFLPTVTQSATVADVYPPPVEQQAYDPAASSFQQFNPPPQLPASLQHYSSVTSTPIHSSQMAPGGTHNLDSASGCGMMHGADASGLFGVPAFRQPGNPYILSNQVQDSAAAATDKYSWWTRGGESALISSSIYSITPI